MKRLSGFLRPLGIGAHLGDQYRFWPRNVFDDAQSRLGARRDGRVAIVDIRFDSRVSQNLWAWKTRRLSNAPMPLAAVT